MATSSTSFKVTYATVCSRDDSNSKSSRTKPRSSDVTATATNENPAVAHCCHPRKHRRNQRNSRASDGLPVSIEHPSERKTTCAFDLSSIPSEQHRWNFQRHLSRCTWIDPNTLEFGDVFNMCVAHEVYGVALRYYQFWKTVQVDGRACPLFLCQITNSHRGPIDNPSEFFQSCISFILEDRPERSVFVSAVHGVVIVPPAHGKIFVQPHKDRKGSPRECSLLKSKLDHLVKEHPGLLARLCNHTKNCHVQGQNGVNIDGAAAIKDFLQCHGKEACRACGCSLSRQIIGKVDNLLREHKNGLHSRKKRQGGRSSKLQPPQDLCRFLTGEGRHYSPVMYQE